MWDNGRSDFIWTDPSYVEINVIDDMHFVSLDCLFGTNPLLNTLRPRQNGHHFPDDIFKWIFLNENVWISINISLKCVPRGPINNIPTLIQVMAWRRPGDKPLSEPMMVRLPTHICVSPPHWVITLRPRQNGLTPSRWQAITWTNDG